MPKAIAPRFQPSDTDRRLLQERLIAWFRAGHRDLPWRRVRDPYAIWVSEIMLQQTQVATVIPYYERFMARFPTVASLAEAPLEDVLSLWRGLGYYARARNLQRGARYVLGRHGGQVPSSLEEILEVPGIGRYTAGAILSIAYGVPAALLDGNVARVYCRVFGREEDPRSPAGQKLLWGVAEALVPATGPGDYNQALMELGALVCTPSSPSCERCPVAACCVAGRLPDPAALPVKGAVRTRPEVRAVGLVIRNADGAMLFGLRPAEGLLGGMWELPTAVLAEEERIDAAIRRVGLERLGVAVAPTRPAVVVEHIFTHLKLVLYGVECSSTSTTVSGGALVAGAGEAAPRRGRRRGVDQIEVPYQDWRWVAPEGLTSLPMGRATLKVLEGLSAPDDQLELFHAIRRRT